jgi:transcriptional regulator with XRE-family HTH domain
MLVKEIRKQNGWSQNQLSELSGLSVKTIQRIENGKVSPSLETAKSLAAVFGRDFNEFYELDSQSAPAASSATQAADSPAISAHKPAEKTALAQFPWQYASVIFVILVIFVVLGFLILRVDRLFSEMEDLVALQTLNQNQESGPSIASMPRTLRAGAEEFTSFYGQNAIQSLLIKPEGAQSDAASISLLELGTLLQIARIFSSTPERFTANAEVTLQQVLTQILTCYASSRGSITEQPGTESFNRLFVCVDGPIADNRWILGAEQRQNLADLEASVEGGDNNLIRRLVIETNGLNR